MNRARRLAASVLLLVMVPSLALAAMPLRNCIGPSGHQAIEFVIDGVLHSGNHESHEQAAHDPVGCAGEVDAFADGEKCTDKALMDTVSAPPTAPDLKLLPAFAVAIPVRVQFLSRSGLSAGDGLAVFNRHQTQVDPCIEVRRTVVLLI